MVMSKWAVRVFGIAALAALLGSLSFGQTTTGTILGVVADETGARVPGVTVTVTNLDTAISRTLATDAAGRYRASSLPSGNYEMKAEMAGFKTAVRRGVQLSVGAETVVDLTLSIGQVSEQVEVTGEAPVVETTNATVSGLVNDQQVRDLPLNGRSLDNLIFLQTGVSSYLLGDQSTENGGGIKFTVSGSRITANSFLLDGTNINDQSNTTPGSAAGKMLGVETLREFRVLTSNYSAEYGRFSGGVMTAVTKSGTNNFHGNVFYFARNDALDARNFFDQQKPSFTRSQFGATAGGPIQKDRTFFFLGYEGLRESLGASKLGFVPIAEARNGFLRNSAGVLQPVALNPAVRPYLELYPLPNGQTLRTAAGVLTNTAEVFSNPTQPTREDYNTVKLDHQFTNSHSFFARYTISDSNTQNNDATPVHRLDYRARNQYVTLQETAILSPKAVNVARFGFNRSFSFTANTLLANIPKSLNFFPGQQFGSITFQSGGISAFGNNVAEPQLWAHNVESASDDITLTEGKHTLKMGFLFDRYQENTLKQRSYGGVFIFADLPNFLSNNPFSVEFPPAGNDSNRGWRQSLFGVYLQDDFQVNSHLMLNLGLRYEMATIPTEVNGKTSNYNDVLHDVAAKPHIGDPWFKGGKKDFAPRVGFAWDPFGSGKTSIRSGFGLYFDHVIGLPYNRATARVFPFAQDVTARNSAASPVTFPFISSDLKNSFNPLLLVNYSLNATMLDPAKVSWNFGIQQQVAANTMVSASYVGSRSYHLSIGENGNQAFSQTDPTTGRKFIPQPAKFRNPNLGQIQFYLENVADSSYHGLDVSVNRRMTRGLQAQFSYTYSKNISESDSVLGRLLDSESRTGATVTQNFDDRRADRGVSLFDFTHALSANVTYELPFARHLTGVGGAILSGWAMNSILTVATGNPFSMFLGFDRSNARVSGGNSGDRPDLKPGGNSNPVLGKPSRWYDPSQFTLQPVGFFGNLGKNTVRAPGHGTLDLSLVKNTALHRISESSSLQFRAELFNILNRANFGVPFNQPLDQAGNPDPRAGVIDRTVTTSRQIQFGLKLTF